MDKAALLWRYPGLKSQVAELDEKILDEKMRLETVYGLSAVDMDGMPHGTDVGDPTVAAAAQAAPIRERLHHLQEAQAWRLGAMTEVERYLDKLDALERPVIEMRYFRRLSWDAIADAQSVSRATVMRLHCSALRKWQPHDYIYNDT